MGYLFQTSSKKEGLDLYNPEYKIDKAVLFYRLSHECVNVLLGSVVKDPTSSLVNFAVRSKPNCIPPAPVEPGFPD